MTAATAHWYAEHLGFQMAGAFPEREPYDWEFEVRDPNGYILVFGEYV